MAEPRQRGTARPAEMREPSPSALVFHTDPGQLSRWTELLSQACRVVAASDLDRLQEALADPQVKVLVCDWQDQLLDNIEASRLAVRLVHCGESIPDGIIEAAALGHQVLIVDRPEELAATVSHLISPRSASRRQRLRGFTVRSSSAPNTYELWELSNEGFSLHIEPDQSIDDLLPGNVLEDVEIFRDNECGLAKSTAVVRHVRLVDSSSGSYSVGCWFRGSKRADAHAVRLIRDRAWCAALLRTALSGGGIFLQTMDDSGLPTHCLGGVLKPSSGEFTVNALKSADHPFSAPDVARGRFELGGSVYRFHATVVARLPLTLRLPKVIEETQGRSSPRSQPALPEPMVVELASPLLSSPAVKLVRDISGAGFSFEIDAEREVFPVGMRFTRIELRSGDQKIRCRGQVRSLARIPERPGALHCGVGYESLDESTRVRLADVIMRGRFPDLRDGKEVPFAEVWDFFLRTNFMYPDKLKKLEPILPQIRQTFTSANARANRVFKSVVFTRDQEIVGYVSGLRAYRNTWMSQHLAAAPGGRGGQLLNFGLAEYFSQNIDLEFGKIFFRPENRWPSRVFGGFARRVNDPQISDLRVHTYFTLPTDPQLVPAAAGIEVVEPSTKELRPVERYFVEKERGLLLKANDLTRGALQLGELDAEFAQLGLRRYRRVLLALQRDVPVGFALAELSSPGLNLSELLSAFSIYVFDRVERPGEVERALLRALLQMYRNAGRPFAVGLIPPDHLPRYQYLPLSSIKQYACWTSHRALYFRFLDHIARIVRALKARQAAHLSARTVEHAAGLSG